MTVFADSSAVVKLYAAEVGSNLVREIAQFTVAQTTRVEVPAALWRMNRMRLLTPRLTAALVGAFQDDWFGQDSDSRFGIVRMTSLVLEDAARITGVHGLRGYEAIQLASAKAVRTADPSISTFAVFDGALRDAAATEGFVLLP